MAKKPVVLIVRDGWGRNPNAEHDAFNAVKLAQIFEPTPTDGEREPSPEELSYSIVSAVSQAMEAQFVIESAPEAGTSATLKIPLAPAKRREEEPQAEAPQQVFVPVEAVN